MERRSFTAIFFVLILVWPLRVFAAPLTLEAAFAAARERAEALPLQEARLRRAEATVDRVKGQIWPKLDLSAQHTRQDTPNSGTSFSSSSSFRSRQSSSISVGANQTVFDGALLSGLNAVRNDREAAEQNWRATEVGLYAEVARRFYAVLAAEKEVENLRVILKLAQDRLAELRKRVKIGRSRRSETLTSESQLQVLAAQLDVAQGEVQSARNSFAMVTGIDRDVALTCELELPKLGSHLQAYLKRLQDRPDLAAAKAQLEAAESRVTVAKSGHLPKVNLFGNYYLLRKGASEGIDWDVGGGITLPLFAGGSTVAAVREASEDTAQAELNLRQRTRAAEEEIRSAYTKMAAALEQVKTLEQAVEISERSYKEQNREYGFSLVTNIDVIQALNLFQDAKRTLDRARFQARIAWAELNAAIASVPNDGRKSNF